VRRHTQSSSTLQAEDTLKTQPVGSTPRRPVVGSMFETSGNEEVVMREY
jgi:hypothetical protein